MRPCTFFAMALLLTVSANAQPVAVPNGDFERGSQKDVPGWTLEGGLDGGIGTDRPAEGKGCLTIRGDGKASGAWLSQPLELKPSSLYVLAFLARGAGSGGTPTTGTTFCNMDLGKISPQWTVLESFFFTPREIAPHHARLRFGQWEVKGATVYDNVQVHHAQAAHERKGDLELGEGESVEGNQYRFHAPLGGRGRHFSRPLHSHNTFFNSNRWCFGAGGDVIYRHQVGSRKQTAAELSLGVTYYAGGELVVEASRDGKSWTELGRIGDNSSRTFAVPASLLPADAVWVRLRGQRKGDKGGCSIQISDYGYRATVDGSPERLRGRTHYFGILAGEAKADVRIESVGTGLPGADNQVVVRSAGATVLPSLEVAVCPSGVQPTRWTAGEVRQGRAVAPYDVPTAGPWDLWIKAGEFQAVTSLHVPELHNASYGLALPSSSEAVALWWASSGWKVSKLRPAPKAGSQAMVIRTARNEAEAAQVVLRPAKPLKGLTARATALKGPGGAALDPSTVEILRVQYLDVTVPTDVSSVAGDWPDPLPPLDGPLNVEAGTNQPLWVRVKAPRDAAAGTYEGRIELKADGYSAIVPLRVEVFDFALPDRMTCQTSLGFGVHRMWQYHRLTSDAQRREVLGKYLASFASHHISPYDPAPMDHFRVHWPKAVSRWRGGRTDRGEKHAGAGSLLVVDDNDKAPLSASYEGRIAIPPKGLRLRVWHKAPAGHKFMFALNHHDAKGEWMSGRNLTLAVVGTGDWAQFDRTITEFPDAARSVTLNIYPAMWSEGGEGTGKVWLDDLSLREPDSQRELIEGGDFEPPSPEQLQPRIDWDDWDAAMKVAMEQYHFNSFMVPIHGMGGGTFHERYEPSLLGYGENDPEYKALFTSYCRQVQEHLRQKGWLDRAFVYWFDEPDPKDYEFVNKGFARLKAAGPDLTRMLTEQVEDALIGGPNLWCPVSFHYDHDRAEKRRAAGERFWWYVCCGPKAPYATLFLDHPAVELRVWLWQTWQRRIDGILVWETVYWHSPTAYPGKELQNPYEDPMSWVSGYSTPKGARRPWGNGDGRFLYPPPAAVAPKAAGPVLDGPVESIRWEMLRDGIEDYEYMVILRRLLDGPAGKKLSPDELAKMKSLLDVPEEISKDMTRFTRRPEPIERHREQVARAIADLSGR